MKNDKYFILESFLIADNSNTNIGFVINYVVFFKNHRSRIDIIICKTLKLLGSVKKIIPYEFILYDDSLLSDYKA